MYFYFFSVVEPSFTLIGAIFAILFPVKYFDESMSFQDVVLLGERGGGARGLLVTRALGNCEFKSERPDEKEGEGRRRSRWIELNEGGYIHPSFSVEAGELDWASFKAAVAAIGAQTKSNPQS